MPKRSSDRFMIRFFSDFKNFPFLGQILFCFSEFQSNPASRNSKKIDGVLRELPRERLLHTERVRSASDKKGFEELFM